MGNQTTVDKMAWPQGSTPTNMNICQWMYIYPHKTQIRLLQEAVSSLLIMIRGPDILHHPGYVATPGQVETEKLKIGSGRQI